MADDIEQDIVITADGTAAIDAIGGVSDSVDSLGESFQHVGVHIFGRELLASMGIAGQARPVIMALQASVTALTASFGGTVAAIAPYVAIAAGLIAVIYELVNATRKHSENLEQNIQSLNADIKASQSLTDTLSQYQDRVGELTPTLEKLSQANKVLYQSQLDLKKVELQDQIKQLTDALEQAQGPSVKWNENWSEANKNLEKSEVQWHKNHTALLQAQADLEALNKGFSSLNDEIAKNVSEWSEAGMAADKGFQEWNKGQDEMIKEQEKVGQEFDQNAQSISNAWMNMSERISSGVGSSFAKSIMHGQAFGQSMHNVFQSIEQSGIQAFVNLATKALTTFVLQETGMVAAKTATDTFSGSLLTAAGAATALRTALMGIP